MACATASNNIWAVNGFVIFPLQGDPAVESVGESIPSLINKIGEQKSSCDSSVRSWPPQIKDIARSSSRRSNGLWHWLAAKTIRCACRPSDASLNR